MMKAKPHTLHFYINQVVKLECKKPKFFLIKINHKILKFSSKKKILLIYAYKHKFQDTKPIT